MSIRPGDDYAAAQGVERAVTGDGAASIDLCVAGGATFYRLFDVGYQIYLDRARELLAAQSPERVRPSRG